VSDITATDGVVDATVNVEWRGLTLALPSTIEDCDLEVLEAFEDGKAATFVRSLLGPAQWAQVRATGPMKVRDLAEIGELIAKALGFASPGE
jgi:hypothetical protein